MESFTRTLDKLMLRQPGESPHAHTARVTYLALGPGRTIKEVGEMPEYKPGSPRGWSKLHHWASDALLFDECNCRLMLEKASEASQRKIEELNKIMWEVLEIEVKSCKQAALDAVAWPLAFAQQRKLNMDVFRCAATTSRLISDRPTQIMDLKIGPIDAVNMPDDLLEAVARGGQEGSDALMQVSQENAGKSVGVTTENVSVTATGDVGVTEETGETVDTDAGGNAKEPMEVE